MNTIIYHPQAKSKKKKLRCFVAETRYTVDWEAADKQCRKLGGFLAGKDLTLLFVLCFTVIRLSKKVLTGEDKTRKIVLIVFLIFPNFFFDTEEITV